MNRPLPLMLAVTLVIAGCGGSESSSNDAEVERLREQVAALTEQVQGSTPTDDGDEESEGEELSAGEVVDLGDTLTFENGSGDVNVDVTVTKVLDPAPVGDYDEPEDSSARLVGVELRIKNNGSRLYEGFPDATLVYGEDEQTDTIIVSGGACAGFSDSVSIRTGSARKGCVVFEVPAGKNPKRLQFVVDPVEPGEWRLR